MAKDPIIFNGVYILSRDKTIRLLGKLLKTKKCLPDNDPTNQRICQQTDDLIDATITALYLGYAENQKWIYAGARR